MDNIKMDEMDDQSDQELSDVHYPNPVESVEIEKPEYWDSAGPSNSEVC